jgi:hypothetical protein
MHMDDGKAKGITPEEVHYVLPYSSASGLQLFLGEERHCEWCAKGTKDTKLRKHVEMRN